MENERKSVIILPVPETEEVVEVWRKKYDPVASLGVPPHITLIYPFIPPSSLNQKIISELRLFFKNLEKFRFSLTEIGTFPSGVILLKPYPKENFVEIIKGLEETFGVPSFEGKFPEINPHLTLANHIEVEVFKKLLEEIPSDVNKKLPIGAVVNEAWLMETDDTGYWHLREKFSFK